MMMEQALIDPNFEPRARARSNTWPLRPQVEPQEALSDPPAAVTEEVVTDSTNATVTNVTTTTVKKSNARRNAWGNLSYADLITQAITSAPDQRLTLSQIYDWMVQNVPYFKDKGDSNSSAGWKNSIRHNLSLHSRFVRTQNEGAGKSSWWIINPDAKSGKPRRRAYSMETKDKEMARKRGRARKKVEALRAASDGLGSPTSTISENQELLTEPRAQTLQLSPEFRPRTSSNASSCGRISPLRPQLLQDDGGLSPVSWNRGSTSSLNLPYNEFNDMLNLTDMITLADSTVQDSGFDDMVDLQFSQYPPQNYVPNYQTLPPPPPYRDQGQNSPLQGQGQGQLMLNTITSTVSLSPDQLSPHQPIVSSSGGQMHQLQNMQQQQQQQQNTTPSQQQQQPATIKQEYVEDVNMYPNSPMFTQQLNQQLINNSMNGQGLNGQRSPLRQAGDSILRAALTKPHAPTLASLLTAPDGPMDGQIMMDNMPMDGQPQFPPADFDLGPMSEWQDFGCDVNEVINHELTVDGSLDCTFDSINPTLANDF